MPRKNRPKETAAKNTLSWQTAQNNCTNKQRFLNQTEANRAASLKNLQDSTLDLQTYNCALCRGWHLTRRG